jgi:hypothetical protein
MKMWWRLILCAWGLTQFALITYHAIRVNEEMHHGHRDRYFWWSFTRLDSDPLNKHSSAPMPCADGTEGCFDPEYIWITPGLMQKALVLSALPAFVLGLGLVRGLAHLGVSEIVSFMFAMPVFITAWFYFVGWLLDRWRYKRSLSAAATQG